jgi:hypothetical protein
VDRLDAEVVGRSAGILFNRSYGEETNRASAEPMKVSSKHGRWTCEWQTCEDGGSTFIRNAGTTFTTRRTYKQEDHQRKCHSVSHCCMLTSEFESVSQRNPLRNRDLAVCSCRHQ